MPRLTKNDKGLATAILVLIIVVVVAVIGVVVWQVTKKSPSTTASSTASTSTTKTVTVNAACLKDFSDSKLCAFAEHTALSTMQYVAVGTATNAAGTSTSFTVKSDGKGDKDITYMSGSEQISAVILDGITYVQESAGGTWYEYTTGGSSFTAADPTLGFTFNFNQATAAGVSVTKEGTAACGSLTCYKYKVIDSTIPGGTAYVYFDTNAYLLRQWTSTNTTTGISVNLTFSYPAVTITEPSPVQQTTT